MTKSIIVSAISCIIISFWSAISTHVFVLYSSMFVFQKSTLLGLICYVTLSQLFPKLPFNSKIIKFNNYFL